MKFVVGLALSAALCGAAAAQDAAPAPETAATPLPALETPAPAATETAAPQGHVVGGSIIDLEIAEPLSSKTHKQGDGFALRLVRPIESDEGVLVPAGATGRGEVISAAKAGMLGKPGELLLAARYLDHNGLRVPLRTFRLGASGKDNAAVVMAASFVIPVAFLIKGGDIEIPAGTRASAKLAADLTLPILPDAPVAAPVSTTTQKENSQ